MDSECEVCTVGCNPIINPTTDREIQLLSCLPPLTILLLLLLPALQVFIDVSNAIYLMC